MVAPEHPPAPKRLVHVDGAARRPGDGTRSRPFRTIQRGLAELRAGVEVIVHAGTYDERLVVARGGVSGTPASVRAASGERVEITGRLKIEADHVSVAGLVFSGSAERSADVLVYVAGADDVLLRGNEVRRARLSGIFVGEGADRVRVVANWVHDNGTDPALDHGIYVERSTGGTISDNLIERNAGYGIQLYPDADGMIVTHNTVAANGRSGIILGGEAETSDENIVANNVVVFNAEQGIRTFWGGSAGIGNRVVANLVFANPEANISLEGVPEADTLEEDPRFVGIGQGDYSLSDDSPAIDKASSTYVTRTDFDGTLRPQGAASDLGAFEHPAG